MKHTKTNCRSFDQIIADRCGLACANCGACKCGTCGNAILLEDWARANGIHAMDAKNMARRNKLKTAQKRIFPVLRWTVDKNEKPPLK